MCVSYAMRELLYVCKLCVWATVLYEEITVEHGWANWRKDKWMFQSDEWLLSLVRGRLKLTIRLACCWKSLQVLYNCFYKANAFKVAGWNWDLRNAKWVSGNRKVKVCRLLSHLFCWRLVVVLSHYCLMRNNIQYLCVSFQIYQHLCV